MTKEEIDDRIDELYRQRDELVEEEECVLRERLSELLKHPYYKLIWRDIRVTYIKLYSGEIIERVLHLNCSKASLFLGRRGDRSINYQAETRMADDKRLVPITETEWEEALTITEFKFPKGDGR